MLKDTITFGKQVVISDPCYVLDGTLQATYKMKPGKYRVKVKQQDGRNAILEVIHNDHFRVRWYPTNESIGVDSGQAGFFSLETYRNDDHLKDVPLIGDMWEPDEREGEKWYIKVSDLTLNTPESYGTYDQGVVSQSGWGDGSYRLEVAKEGKVNVGLRIIFLEEEEDGDYEEEEDGDYDYGW